MCIRDRFNPQEVKKNLDKAIEKINERVKNLKVAPAPRKRKGRQGTTQPKPKPVEAAVEAATEVAAPSDLAAETSQPPELVINQPDAAAEDNLNKSESKRQS